MLPSEFLRIKTNNMESVQPDRTTKKLCDRIDELQILLKKFTNLDCCTGYLLREDDLPVFWDALDEAREYLRGF